MPPLRILLAEDEPALREILSEGLRDEGFEVEAAGNGLEAIDLFRRAGPFDVLLLDEEMPRLTGRLVLERLRADGVRVPALLFSGNLELTDAERTRLGVGPVLRKPLPMADLCAAIRAVVG